MSAVRLIGRPDQGAPRLSPQRQLGLAPALLTTSNNVQTFFSVIWFVVVKQILLAVLSGKKQTLKSLPSMSGCF